MVTLASEERHLHNLARVISASALTSFGLVAHDQLEAQSPAHQVHNEHSAEALGTARPASAAGITTQDDATAVAAGPTGSVPGLDRLKHVVVIYLENHSFDNLYGEFPAADGLAHADATSTQVDGTGKPFSTLPFPSTPPFTPFPTNRPNAPFSIEQYVPANANTPDLVHRFYQEQVQIDGGKAAGGRSLGARGTGASSNHFPLRTSRLRGSHPLTTRRRSWPSSSTGGTWSR